LIWGINKNKPIENITVEDFGGDSDENIFDTFSYAFTINSIKGFDVADDKLENRVDKIADGQYVYFTGDNVIYKMFVGDLKSNKNNQTKDGDLKTVNGVNMIFLNKKWNKWSDLK
jgi:uncharacterized membrane protein